MLEISPSGYYAWLKREPSNHAKRDAELAERIGQIHDRLIGHPADAMPL